MKQTLTHSRMDCFRFCPQKHYLRYERGIAPEKESKALSFGRLFHAVKEALDKGIDLEPLFADQDPFMAASVWAMVHAHRQRYGDDHDLEVVATEQVFSVPLKNPDTGGSTQNWILRGKLDRIVKMTDGRLALMEYKTTKRDFSPGAEYWVQLRLDQQISIYLQAARQMGYDIKTVLYDVTRRPALRPLKATPEDKRKYNKKTGDLYANQRDTDETPEEFMHRILEDVADRPEHYFTRIEIARTEADINDASLEIWQVQKAIREAQKSGHWYKNPRSCFNYGECPYLPICVDGSPNNLPSGLVVLNNVHPELEEESE